MCVQCYIDLILPTCKQAFPSSAWRKLMYWLQYSNARMICLTLIVSALSTWAYCSWYQNMINKQQLTCPRKSSLHQSSASHSWNFMIPSALRTSSECRRNTSFHTGNKVSFIVDVRWDTSPILTIQYGSLKPFPSIARRPCPLMIWTCMACIQYNQPLRHTRFYVIMERPLEFLAIWGRNRVQTRTLYFPW